MNVLMMYGPPHLSMTHRLIGLVHGIPTRSAREGEQCSGREPQGRYQ